MARRRTRPNIEFDTSVAEAADFFWLEAVAEPVVGAGSGSVTLAIGLIDVDTATVLVSGPFCANKVLATPSVEFPTWRKMWASSVG